MKDQRYCYGANCTWYGPIQEAGNTGSHAKHQAPLKVKVGDRVLDSKNFPLPCCPLCGGMLLQLDTKDEWDKWVADYDKSHPGYKTMYAWQKEVNRCFPTIGELVDAFSIATGTVVKLGSQQITQ